MSRGIVYVVDDEEPIRRSLRMLLRTLGWSAELFESGVAFLDAVDHLSPGCALLDVRMPELDGMVVLQRLAQRGIAMPVIVMTGHGDLPAAAAALQCGAFDFIEKPFERTRLLEALVHAQMRLFDPESYRALGRDAEMAIARLHVVDRAVLAAFVQGQSNQSVAALLNLSLVDVEVSRARIIERLGAQSLIDAIRIAALARSNAAELGVIP